MRSPRPKSAPSPAAIPTSLDVASMAILDCASITALKMTAEIMAIWCQMVEMAASLFGESESPS
jgi:hypothetical protein